MYKLEEGKYLNPASDVVFKNIMKDSENRDYLAKIISIVTGLDYDYVKESIVIVDTDTLENNAYEHHNIGDLVINIENTKINIEASLNNPMMNKVKNEIMYYKYASNDYKTRSDYKNFYYFIQICVENYNVFSNDLIINESRWVEISSGKFEVETARFKKFHINLNILAKKSYNELTKDERYLKLLSTDDIDELSSIAKGDKIMEKVVKKLDVLSHDEDILDAYDNERIKEFAFQQALVQSKKEGKEEGLKCGIERGIRDTAIELLKNNVDKQMVAKCTGLSLDEIDVLTKNI